MTTFLELLISGVSLGSVYALIALGFVIIYKSTEVVNFAHASLLLAGGYIAVRAQESLGFWGGLLAGVAGAALLGTLLETLVIRRYRGADPAPLAIVTIGVDIVLLTELGRRIGPDIFTFEDPWGNALLTAGSVTVPQTRVAAFLAAALLIAVFLAAFRWTPWGLSMRAAAENRETAALMGIRLGRVSASAWAVAGALAAVAALFLSVFPTSGLDRDTGQVALAAFPAAIIGGLDSTTGALAGGLIVGLTEALTTGYADELAFLGSGFGELAPYVVMVLVLLARPSGLFGMREPSRV
ncbi:branched-chain amino acid ABC transporter permease [Streptomyces sp. DSM 44917]|uniref:Branched-chain amino acid ABC transporter permease n=1 Tax=Streptomyces boetiae TaxID=3075541 RepID=A0ABU2L9H7_9ACTN|nr:branched-chain amino acid ABC transporter permease [Streptomyces sp. DSM 44917]MDT0307933.1 branched-chain amino acid ABC transporter permease [Streptomyces sp. DSM 44917]